MADRGEIKDAFYSELSTAAATTFNIEDANGNVIDTITVDSSNVGVLRPEEEETPSVLFDTSYTALQYNGVGSSENVVLYDVNDNEDKYIFHEYRRAQFEIFVRATSESSKEPIYEAVHRAFGKYDFGPWSASSFHGDCINIQAQSTISNDATDSEDIINSDSLTVIVDFHRNYEFTTDNITEIATELDVDDDDVADVIASTT